MEHILETIEHDLVQKERDLSSLSPEEQFALLKARSREMVDAGRLLNMLRHAKERGEPLRIKYGIDPTAKEIHLGHIVPVIVARRFLQMGHEVTILFGNFTAFVGDPTGRLLTRPILTQEEIAENVRHYKEQVARFIDVGRIKTAFNATFYDPKVMSILDFFTIVRKNSVAPLLQREDFRKRQESGLTIAEFLYPMLMAIDSVKMETHIELGGADQLLNFQITKTVMEREGMQPQTAVTTDLLESTAGDGKKMSKSEGNYVPLTASAEEVYSKIMSIPDKSMEQYFKLLTDISDATWETLTRGMHEGTYSPKEVKQLLARVITTWMHDAKAAHDAEERFATIFSRREIPETVPETTIPWHENLTWTEIAATCNLATSKSAFRRLMESNSVKVFVPPDTEGVPLKDPNEKVASGTYILKYGRGKFVKCTVK